MDLKKFYSFFENYTNEYINNSKTDFEKFQLIRKKEHSYRVIENGKKIVNSMNLNEEEVDLVILSCLLHDIGRFYQFKTYNTYDDDKSENHAEISVKEIVNSNILNNLDKSTKDIILTSIKYHNTMYLPDNLSNKELLISRILRDADKLDFFYSMVYIEPTMTDNQKEIFYTNKSNRNTISNLVYSKILNKEAIKTCELKTKLEKKVRALGFITSDMNYLESLKIFMEHDYLNKIYDTLPKTHKVITIYNFISNYINSKLQ